MDKSYYYYTYEKQLFNTIINTFKQLFINGKLDALLYKCIKNNTKTTYIKQGIYVIQYIHSLDYRNNTFKKSNYYGYSNNLSRRRSYHITNPKWNYIVSNLYTLLSTSQVLKIIDQFEALSGLINYIVQILLNYPNNFTYYHPYVVSILCNVTNLSNKQEKIKLIETSLAFSLVESYLVLIYGQNFYSLESIYSNKVENVMMKFKQYYDQNLHIFKKFSTTQILRIFYMY